MEFFLLPSMPRSFLFTSFLLISHWTTCGHAVPAFRMAMKAIAVDDLRHGCAVGLDDLSYDLCPLMGRTVTIEDTSYTVHADGDRGKVLSSRRRFYDVTLGGVGGERTESGCDDDTWVCMRELPSPVPLDTDLSQLHRDQLRSTPIARKLKAISLGSGQALHLDLDGGLLNDIPQSAVIEFSCSHQDKLIFVGEFTGVHSFVWATRHACPRHTTGFRNLISVMQDEADEPVPEGEGEKEGDDDLLPNQNRNTMRRWIAIILVVVATSLFCGYLASSSRARHFTSEKLKGVTYVVLPQVYVKLRPIGQSISHFASNSIVRLGTRFRQGDNQLVRWAEEDMALDDAGDVMVNGAGAYDRDDEGWTGMDEYIPLTISPKYGKSRRVRSYGSTPDVETFEERGVMNGIGRFFRR